MKRKISATLLLTLILLSGFAVHARQTDQTIAVGVAWQGQSMMPERVLAGLQQVLAGHIPEIQLDVRKELKDLNALEQAITEFESSKQAMVILRSNGAELLGQRGAAIPAFIGGTNNPVELGAAYALDRPKPNITGVTYYLPARLKLETFQQVYPSLSSYLLLVEADHPGSRIDADETKAAAMVLDLTGTVVFCSTLNEALAAIAMADEDAAVILGAQALLMDNANRLVAGAGSRPMFSYAEKPVADGALAGMVADDNKLGQMLGRMLIDVVTKRVSVDTLPIQTDPEPKLRLNPAVVDRFKERIPLAVKSLAHAEQMLASIYHVAPTGIGLMEQEVLVEVNDYIVDLTGYSRDELLGQSTRMLYSTREEYEEVKLQSEQQISAHGAGSVEVQWRAKDGQSRHVLLAFSPFNNADPGSEMVFTALDITGHHLAEVVLEQRTQWFLLGMAGLIFVLLALVGQLTSSLRQGKRIRKNLIASESLLERSQEIAHVGSWQLDLAHNRLTWSNQVYRIFGCEPQEFAATYEAFLAFVHPEDRTKVNAAYTDSLRDKSSEYVVEHRIVQQQTENIRHVRQKCIHERDAAGNVLFSIGMIQDISERKLTELALQASERHLTAKNKELEQVVYVASHDLRSPLVNIDGFSRELEYSLKDISDALDTNVQEHTEIGQLLRTEFPDMQLSLARIRTSAKQMDILLKGLLKISRLGRAALNIESIGMNLLLKELVASFAFSVQEQKIELIVEDLPACLGDAMQVTQVFSNLLDNAIKFLDPQRPGQVQICGQVEAGQAVYRVIDNGIGISANHQNNIFELFHRLHPGQTEGEGLGLTIVRQILFRLGGEIKVESSIGCGSTFVVRLPAVA